MLFPLVLWLCVWVGPTQVEAAPSPAAVVEEFDRLAARPLWPGFDPRATPIAIYDGERTWLFRHPNPPEGFTTQTDQKGVWTYPGQHPAVRANTSANLGGISTATFIASLGTKRTVTQSAGIVIHETFHVFQREHHPKWQANEAELFVYPLEEPGPLCLRRLESEALRRALQSTNPAQTAGWAKLALAMRGERFAKLPTGSVEYERGTELYEGLAEYVERRATGETGELPPEEYGAEAVRIRSYAVGRTLAQLLDRFDSVWKDKLEAGATEPLDELLARSLVTVEAPRMDFAAAERSQALQRAQADTAALQEQRAAVRKDFLARPGWKLLIVANVSDPLWPQGFDPLNVQKLTASEVLHTRFLKLGNSRAVIEVLNHASMSEGAGAHPLFQGVSRLTITGLAAEPAVEKSADNGKVVVKGNGIQGEFQNATVERMEKTITISLGKP